MLFYCVTSAEASIVSYRCRSLETEVGGAKSVEPVNHCCAGLPIILNKLYNCSVSYSHFSFNFFRYIRYISADYSTTVQTKAFSLPTFL